MNCSHCNKEITDFYVRISEANNPENLANCCFDSTECREAVQTMVVGKSTGENPLINVQIMNLNRPTWEERMAQAAARLNKHFSEIKDSAIVAGGDLDPDVASLLFSWRVIRLWIEEGKKVS